MIVTIEVEESVVKQLKAVAYKKSLTLEETVAAMARDGVKSYCYRVQRNARVYAQGKELRKREEEILAKARELGLLADTDGEGDDLQG